MAFEVASIHPTKPGEFTPPNMGLDNGDGFNPTGGLFKADFPLFVYISFAYKIRMTEDEAEAMVAHLPKWVTDDNYEIHARGPVNATKDQMRLMMQSLLARRFGLAVHYEPRQVAVFALTPVRPGAMGPKLQPHPAATNCSNWPPPTPTPDAAPIQKQPETITGGFPTVCGGILGVPASARDRYSLGGRNVSMNLIASSLSSWGHLGRPVVNRTDLAGAYDFVLEFTPDPPPAYAQGIDSDGPTFQEALRQQLGMKLESQKAPIDFLIIDHVERPSSN